MDILLRLGLMVALVGVGLGARQAGLLTPTRTGRLNAITFYVALPALIFTSTFDRNPAELATVPLLGGLWLTMGVTVLLAWLVHRRQSADARRSVAVVQSYHSNFGYIGLPLVTAGLGGDAAGQAAVLLGLGALTHVPLTTTLLVAINGTTIDPRRTVERLATNPIILTLLVGLGVAAVGWVPPAPATTGLGFLGEAALPLALLCVGASLDADLSEMDWPLAGSVVGIKVLAMPAIAFLAFSALGAPPATVATGVVMFGAPTAVSTYIYAGELGGDTNLASANVLATTLVGVATLSGLLFIFG